MAEIDEIAVIGGNGWNGWKWLERAGIDINGWKWLEMAQLAGNV